MQSLNFPLKQSCSLLFLNGQLNTLPPDLLKNINNYQSVMACDGAWNHLQSSKIANYVEAVVGDGDSLQSPSPPHFIELADQNATDFEKALIRLISLGRKSVDVYWASGGEMDHFLGNLSVAAKYHRQITVYFYDAQQCYFYLESDCQIGQADSHRLTIYPFPEAVVSSQGLHYEMNDYRLAVAEQQSLRNCIISERLTLHIEGAVFLFLSLK